MKALSATDILFLQLEKRQQPMHIGGLFLFKKPKNAPEDYVYYLVERIRTSTKKPVHPFNQVVHNGLFWKEDDEFEIDHHFRHIALPKPGRIRELLVYVSQEHSALLERAKPLWECHIIEGIEDDRFALYFKMHHSVVDGVAAMRIIKKTLSRSAEEMIENPFWTISKPKSKSKSGQLTNSGYNLDMVASQLKTIPTISKELFNSVKDFKNPNFIKSYQTPASVLNQSITSSRRIAAQSYKIERFKKIAKHFGMTINDVVLAVCSGVLRNYLLSNNALPKKTLTAFVPVSLRKDDTDSGNQISFMLANLATNVADPEKRIRIINASIQANKERFSRMNQKEIINYSIVVHMMSMLNLISGIMPKRQGFNLIISNVPGSKEPLYWNGAQLDAMYPLSVLMDGQAMNITFSSYLDKMEFGIVANTRTLPKIQVMLNLIEEELTTFENLVA